MKFFTYITEDYQATREYKKAVFDLNVAIGELEYEEGEPIEKEPEARRRQKESIENLKKSIVVLKEKVVQMAKELGESIEPKLQKLLDKIPDQKDVDPNYDAKAMDSRIQRELYGDITTKKTASQAPKKTSEKK